MSWQLALVGNFIFSAIRGSIQKKMLRDMDPMVFLMYVIAYIELIVISAYLIRHRQLPTLYPNVMVLGMLFGLATTALFAAIKINLTQTSVFGSYRLLVPVMLAAIFLGEWAVITPKTLTGLLIAVTSLYFIATGGQKKKEETVNRRWIVILLSYMILDGLGQFWNKTVLSSHSVLEVLNSQIIGQLPFLFLINRFRNQSMRIRAQHHRWIAADSVAEFSFAVFILYAIQHGPVTLVIPIQTLGTTITGALVGLYVFKEASGFTARRWLGMGLGFVGIILLVL